MSEGNVSAPQPPADGSEMDAGNVPASQSTEPSAGTKRKRLPESADGQTEDGDDVAGGGIGDEDDDDDDVYLADMRMLQTMIDRRFRLQSKNVGVIRRSIADMRLGMTNLQNKLESNRNFMLGALLTTYQKCQERLQTETAKMDKLFEELVKCKAAHEQAVNYALSKLEEGRELLLKQHEESRKNDENIASSFIGEIDKLLKELKERDKGDKRMANLAMMCRGIR